MHKVVVAVDTTDEPASRASAQGLGLDYRVLQEVGPGGGWPEVQVSGPEPAVRQFLADHLGLDADEYFRDFAVVSAD